MSCLNEAPNGFSGATSLRRNWYVSASLMGSVVPPSSISPPRMPSVCQWNIRWRPIIPFGSGSSDSSASRDVSMADAASTTRSPDSVRVAPAGSRNVTPVARVPCHCTLVTNDSARSAARPVSRARRNGASAPARAWIGQP